MCPCEVKQSLVLQGRAQLLHVLSQQRCFYNASRATSAGRVRQCASFSSNNKHECGPHVEYINGPVPTSICAGKEQKYRLIYIYLYIYRESLNPVEGTPSRSEQVEGTPTRSEQVDGTPSTTSWCFWTLSFSRILLVFR